MVEQALLERAEVVSTHDRPQPSPQEFDCGCVTAVYVTDADVLTGGEPFEMRLVEKCGRDDCEREWPRCVFCGEQPDGGEFNDGLRCKMCAEADTDD